MATAYVAIFVDLLGFAILTEGHPMASVDTYRSPSHLQAAFNLSQQGDVKSPLVYRLKYFQHVIQSTCADARQRMDVTAYSFSDSAYIVTRRFADAAGVAAAVMKSLVLGRVPARMGIGYGSFQHGGSEHSQSVGNFHSVQFFGTAIVRSYAAEHDGLRGMRIALHPTALAVIDEPEHRLEEPPWTFEPSVIPCAQLECANKAGVTHELNYMEYGGDSIGVFRAVTAMLADSPKEYEFQYLATLEAIRRMASKVELWSNFL